MTPAMNWKKMIKDMGIDKRIRYCNGDATKIYESLWMPF